MEAGAEFPSFRGLSRRLPCVRGGPLGTSGLLPPSVIGGFPRGRRRVRFWSGSEFSSSVSSSVF